MFIYVWSMSETNTLYFPFRIVYCMIALINVIKIVIDSY